MSRVVVLSVAVGLVACMTGCTSAHYVSKQGDSGVVAIPSNSDSWPFHYRQEAEALMRQHDGPDYEIVDEREVVTGVRVTNSEQTQRDQTPNKKQPNLPGERVTTTGTVTTSNTTEWQITYCRRSAPAVNDFSLRGTGGMVPPVQPAGGTVPVQPGMNGSPQNLPAQRQP